MISELLLLLLHTPLKSLFILEDNTVLFLFPFQNLIHIYLVIYLSLLQTLEIPLFF